MHINMKAVALLLLSIALCTFLIVALGGAASSTDKNDETLNAESVANPVIFSQATAAYNSLAVPSEPPKNEVEISKTWTDKDVSMLAKMLWGEARGVPSDTEKAACVWCVLNRVDQGMGTIAKVVTAPYQFVGYHENNPEDPELTALCEDVLTRWDKEKNGETDVGRVLPSDYLWFTGDGMRNHFRNDYKNGKNWTWDLQSPYEN